MRLIEYLTGKGGILILGLVAIIVFAFRKYKEKRYFKYIDKQIQDKKRHLTD
jgi:hypothetical protein